VTTPAPPGPTSAQLLSLISTLQANIAKAGHTPVVAPANLHQFVNRVSNQAPADPIALANAQKAIAAGQDVRTLPYDVQKLVESTDRIKSTTGPVHRGIFGSITHDISSVGGNALSRVGDVLSRGMYATAEGTKEATDAAASGGNVGDALKAFGSGALKGVEGKQKTSFSDVIQHDADLGKAQGATAAERVAYANEHPGIGHANPWLKYGGGLAADVLLDPTTYVGTGLIGKVVKGADALKTATETTKAAEDLSKLGADSSSEISRILGKGFVKEGRSKLKSLPSAGVTNAHRILATQKIDELAKASAKATEDAAYKEALKTVPKPVDSLKASKAAYQKALNDEARKLMGGVSRDDVRKQATAHLTTLLEKNLSPSVAKEVGLTFAGKRIASVPIGRLTKLANDVHASNNAIGTGLRKFDQGFRGSAGLRNDLKEIKVGTHGWAAHVVKERLHQIQDLFHGSTYAERKQMGAAYRQGLDVKYLGHDGKDMLQEFHKTVNRAQEAVKVLTGEIGSPEEFIKQLPYEMRSMVSAKEVLKAGDLAKGGRRLDEHWLEHFVHKWLASKSARISDPAHIMYSIDKAYLSATSHANMARVIGDTFGLDTHVGRTVFGNKKPLLSRPVQHLIDNHGYRKVKYQVGAKSYHIPYMQGKVFDPETAGGIEKLWEILNDGGHKSDDLLRTFDRAQVVWKSLVTKYNPGYHERNLFGEILASAFGGVKNPQRLIEAGRVLYGRDRTLMGDGKAFGGRIPNRREIKAANAQHFQPEIAGRETGQHVITRQLPNGEKESLTTDQLWHYYVKHGLKTGFIHTDLGFGKEAAKGKIGEFLHNVDQGAQTLTENIEDLTRMAHFIDAFKKSNIADLDKAFAHAASEVRKYHFDFTDFTKFEKAYMVRIFPFYKWTRKNIPLMMEMTLVHPGGAIGNIKAMRAVSGLMGGGGDQSNTLLPHAESVIPSWLQKDLAVPVGVSGSGNEIYSDPAIPWMQAFQDVQSPLQTTGMMFNPLLQQLSLLYNKQTLTGQKVTGAQDLLHSNPITAFIDNLVTNNSQGKSRATTVEQFLSGIAGLQENTPARQEAEAKREQQAAAAERIKYEKQQGTYKSTKHPGVR
jgi:hypothetical protein